MISFLRRYKASRKVFFLYSASGFCVTLGVEHSNKQQNLQPSDCSSADTPCWKANAVAIISTDFSSSSHSAAITVPITMDLFLLSHHRRDTMDTEVNSRVLRLQVLSCSCHRAGRCVMLRKKCLLHNIICSKVATSRSTTNMEMQSVSVQTFNCCGSVSQNSLMRQV